MQPTPTPRLLLVAGGLQMLLRPPCPTSPACLLCLMTAPAAAGTMDALLCCKQGTENVMQMLMEIFR